MNRHLHSLPYTVFRPPHCVRAVVGWQLLCQVRLFSTAVTNPASQQKRKKKKKTWALLDQFSTWLLPVVLFWLLQSLKLWFVAAAHKCGTPQSFSLAAAAMPLAAVYVKGSIHVGIVYRRVSHIVASVRLYIAQLLKRMFTICCTFYIFFFFSEVCIIHK